jgi:hypothetical protein
LAQAVPLVFRDSHLDETGCATGNPETAETLDTIRKTLGTMLRTSRAEIAKKAT